LNQFSRTLSKNGWSQADVLRIGGAMLAAAIATYSAWQHIVFKMLHDEHSHAIVLVPLVALWLFWVRRQRLRFVTPGNRWPGWLMVVAGIQFYFVNSMMDEPIRTAWYLGAILLVGGAFVVTTGSAVLRQFRPVWLVLVFLIPIPVTLAVRVSLPFELLEARMITGLYRLVGIDAALLRLPTGAAHLTESYTLRIGDTTVPMSAACKGLSTIMAMFLISYGFVFGLPLKWFVRLGLLVISPAIAVLCSAVALLCTLWVYDQTAMVTADVVRTVSEWATLLIAFLMLAGVLRLLGWASVPVSDYHLASNH